MCNSIGSWLCISGLIIGPFSIGVLFEEKLQRANRELGSRLLRRYKRLPAKTKRECRTYGARDHPSLPQPFRAGLTFSRRPSGP